MSRTTWSDSDLDYLWQNYAELGPTMVAEHLNKSYMHVCQKAAYLKLRFRGKKKPSRGGKKSE